MAKILVAMSGGIDSSMTALKLKNEGHELLGCYMKLFDDDKKFHENIQSIEKIASFLGIKYEVLDLSEKFSQNVYEPFVQTYKNGRTPNPCIACNATIKFGALIDFAKSKGMDFLATGHYVKVEDGFIAEATDKTKDQSYFLSNIKRENVPFMLFPLGDFLKTDIKKEASKIEELHFLSEKKESSEICFVENSYVEILKKHMDIHAKGDVLDEDGNIVGTHQGYMHYTIGKRRGFEVRGAHEPHYVIKIDSQNNTITVGKKEALEAYNICIKDVNMFINSTDFETEVKIRYRSPKMPCKVQLNGNEGTISLYEPVKGVAPGQRAVFYDGLKVIGSGEII